MYKFTKKAITIFLLLAFCLTFFIKIYFELSSSLFLFLFIFLLIFLLEIAVFDTAIDILELNNEKIKINYCQAVLNRVKDEFNYNDLNLRMNCLNKENINCSNLNCMINAKKLDFILDVNFNDFYGMKKLVYKPKDINVYLSNRKEVKVKRINNNNILEIKKDFHEKITLEFNKKIKLSEIKDIIFELELDFRSKGYLNFKTFKKMSLPKIFELKLFKNNIEIFNNKNTVLIKLPLSINKLHCLDFDLKSKDINLISDDLAKDIEVKKIKYANKNIKFKDIINSKDFFDYTKNFKEEEMITTVFNNKNKANKYLYLIVESKIINESDYLNIKIDKMNLNEEINVEKFKK